MWKKIVGYSVLGVLVLVGGVLGWLWLRKPAQRPAPNVRVQATPARLERGREVWNLADCDGCHSAHDAKFVVVLDGGIGQGNRIRNQELGEIDVPNITPDQQTGIGSWTDGEKIRAIREGVDKDGRALFPMMPYGVYRNMSDDDVAALVAYLDSLPPIHHAVPQMKPPFFIGLMIKSAPKPLDGPVPNPDTSSQEARARYLTAIAGCEDCHTPMERGTPEPGKRFAGGQQFEFNGRVVYSANITPDAQTGIGSWTLPYFRQRIRAYKSSWPEKFTVMPWHNFAQLSDEDLDAIYYYLNEQKPVHNKVNPFQAQQVAQLR